MLRLVLPALLLFPVPSLGQDRAVDADKVSNDRPDRPLQMPPASSEVKEAFDDFERFSRRGAWERALKALYAIPENQSSRFVDGADGFIITVSRKRHHVLSKLPPEGMAAYRDFYDADAKKLLGEAVGAAELKTLERLYSAYFFTSVGDEAADRLAALCYQIGRFDRAAEGWLAILREHPDSELPPALTTVKAAMALARAGRWAEVEPLRKELMDRHAEEVLTIGGKKATAAEHMGRLLATGAKAATLAGPETSEASGSKGMHPSLDLSAPIPALWQVRFAASVVAGMSPAELLQWESHTLSGAIPPVAMGGKRLFANYLGYVFAIDLQTGKMLWRSGAFHHAELPTRQDQSRAIDPKRFAILASEKLVWSLGRDILNPNAMAPYVLTCRRTDTGDLIWRTSDLPEYTTLDLVGTPILVGDTIYMCGKTSRMVPQQRQGQGRQSVLAIRVRDGKLLWSTEVGVLREGQRYYYYGMPDQSASPRLLHRAGAVYVDTHQGVLARLDAETGELDWGYGYATEGVQSGYAGRLIVINGMLTMDTANKGSGSQPFFSDKALYLKGDQSDRIGVLDPDQMTRLWERPIERSARLLGAGDGVIYLGGPELSALDQKTRELKWATRLPGGSADGRVLVRPDGLWQLTPRGIFEIDPATGQVRRIFRGDDMGSEGGDLFLSDRLLLAVTNQTISSYPTGGASVAAPGAGRGAAVIQTGGSDD